MTTFNAKEASEALWRKVREQNVLAASWNEFCVDVLATALQVARDAGAADMQKRAMSCFDKSCAGACLSCGAEPGCNIDCLLCEALNRLQAL